MTALLKDFLAFLALASFTVATLTWMDLATTLA